MTNEEQQRRAEYTAYIKSAQWRNIRALVLRRANNKCERCGATSPQLECHHKTYVRFKQERLSDLEALCADCHLIADLERAQRVQAESASRIHAAAFDTYMEKKYGDDWQFRTWPHWDHYQQEFERWLERKQCDDWTYSEREYESYR